MPWTLYRYILKELLKLLVLSTAVLVLIIGFAATVKPLMDGMLGPMGMLKLLFYTMPTVLGFALPFSAAFASTMVLSRMASDNEIQACRAAGLSYGTILLPVVFLGLSLTLGLYYMSNWVVPSFYRSAEGMIQKNLVQMMVSQVQKNEPVQIPSTNMVVFANSAVEVTPTFNPNWEHQPERLIVFEGVAAGRIVDGELRNEVTAERAEVLLYRLDSETWIQMRLTNALAVDQGHLVQVASAPMAPIRVPNPIQDRARFLSWPDLRKIMRNPEEFDEIAALKNDLIDSMAQATIAKTIGDQLTSGKPVTLKGVGENETYVVTSPRVEQHNQSVLLGASGSHPVLIEQFENGLILSKFEAQQARIEISTGDSQPELKLTMTNVSVNNVRQRGLISTQRSVNRNNLRWNTDVMDVLKAHSAMDLITLAGHENRDVPAVIAARGELNREIKKLGQKLVSQVHERAASAVACLLVLLMGAVLSIKLRDRMPLVVYFWSFLMAFIAVIVINSGDNLAASNSSNGLLLSLTTIWMGNVILLVALGLNFWKLSRT